MLIASTLSQTTNMDKIARRNFLDSQALTVLDFTLLNNLLMYNQPNTKALWAHLWTLMWMPGLLSIFTDYQRTITFQISSDQDSAFQIAKLDCLYIRLHRNNCNIPSFLRTMTFLSTIFYSWDSISTSVLFSHIFIFNLIWDVICSTI